MKQLPGYQLRLAVMDVFREHRHERLPPPSIAAAQSRLWREDPAAVAEAHDALVLRGLDNIADASDGRHGMLAEKLRDLRRPLPWRKRRGIELREIAERVGMRIATLVALMEHHGFLELVPFGGQQRRRLVTETAFLAELGHNVDPSTKRIAKVEGMHRCATFPVFYPDRLADIAWVFDYPGIAATAAGLPKKARLRWLLDNHGYLPVEELAKLSTYSVAGVEKVKASRRPLSMTCNPTFPASTAAVPAIQEAAPTQARA